MIRLGILAIMTALAVHASMDLQFSVHKKESGVPGNTILIIGGIQGDEPGGFMAASLVATKYHITKGNVWVVPNLNFPSIVQSLRGTSGDMNRKFAAIDKTDPDYHSVQRIKSIILDEKVDLILNLHDGSGFYRSSYQDQWHNPNRWGQSSIIDQTSMGEIKFGNLQEIASKVVEDVNKKILIEKHRFHVKNTETKLGDKEMEKALTYFAINNQKPAFANEASKALPVHERVYYQLVAIESYFGQMGIEFERPFTLEPFAVKKAMYEDIRIAFFDNRVVFEVTDVRPELNYVPLKRGGDIEVSTNNPLIAVYGNEKHYRVNYGNRQMTNIYPQYFDYDESLKSITMDIDGEKRDVSFGDILHVKESFKVMPEKGYRTNIIGYVNRARKNESGLKVKKRDFIRRFSVDKKANVYRVEVYKDDKFSGMVLVDFSKAPRVLKKNNVVAWNRYNLP